MLERGGLQRIHSIFDWLVGWFLESKRFLMQMFSTVFNGLQWNLLHIVNIKCSWFQHTFLCDILRVSSLVFHFLTQIDICYHLWNCPCFCVICVTLVFLFISHWDHFLMVCPSVTISLWSVQLPTNVLGFCACVSLLHPCDICPWNHLDSSVF